MGLRTEMRGGFVKGDDVSHVNNIHLEYANVTYNTHHKHIFSPWYMWAYRGILMEMNQPICFLGRWIICDVYCFVHTVPFRRIFWPIPILFSVNSKQILAQHAVFCYFLLWHMNTINNCKVKGNLSNLSKQSASTIISSRLLFLLPKIKHKKMGQLSTLMNSRVSIWTLTKLPQKLFHTRWNNYSHKYRKSSKCDLDLLFFFCYSIVAEVQFDRGQTQ